ncbi:MAG: DNA polymerase III subunit delta' [Phycisphaerae bacterium]
MPLSDVLFQDHVHKRIQRAIGAGRLPHACLFTGPEGVGKEMFATRLAAVLLCSNPGACQAPIPTKESLKQWREACGACDDCRLTAAGTHPDLHVVHRRLNKLHPEEKVRRKKAINLSVDVIRHFLIDRIALRPGQADAKVFIVREADRMTAQAQNALLKTLEEPPGHGYLILLSASPAAMLPTVRSRCQHFAFHALPVDFVRRHLIDQCGLSPEAATLLAETAQGSPGRASRLAQAGLHEYLPDLLEQLRRAASDPLGCGQILQKTAEALAKQLKPRKTASTTDEDDVDDALVDTNTARLAQTLVLAVVATLLRDVLRTAVGHPALAAPGAPAITALARSTTAESVGEAIRAVSAAEYQIARSANSRLIFDTLGIALGRGLRAGRAIA